MTLVSSLVLVFVIFCLMMGGVLGFCLRERKRSAQTSGAAQDAASDRRVTVILVSAIVLGAMLALTCAWLIFFRTWS
jgi:hypothetical protein